MRPKRKSRIETERKILAAGLSVFSKYGFEAASLKQIGKKAGVNEALIIRYYKSKAKLLTSIIFEHFEAQQQASVELPEHATIEEELREFFLREIRSDFKNREFVRLTLGRACVDSKMRRDMGPRWSNRSKEGNPDLIRRLKKFQENGDIAKSIDLVSLSYLLELEAQGFGLTVSLQPKVDQKLLEKHATTFATIVARGLKSTEK